LSINLIIYLLEINFIYVSLVSKIKLIKSNIDLFQFETRNCQF
jgi:hypothetical protein